MKELLHLPRGTRAGRRDAGRVWRLGRVATACLVAVLPALARAEPLRPDRALPCNEFCRAWMSWTPDRRADASRSPPPAGEIDDGERNLRGAPEAVPRSRAPAMDRKTVVAKRAESPDQSPTRPGAVALPAKERPRPRIAHVLTTRPPPTPAPEMKPFGGPTVAGGSALKNDRPSGAVAVPLSGDAADRLLAAADAAVLATPLYRPPEVVGAAGSAIEQGGPERPIPEPEAIGSGSRPDDPALVGGASTRQDVSRIGAASPSVTSSSEVPPAPVEASMPPRIPPRTQVGGVEAPRSRTAMSGAGSAPARPASELERLDRTESPRRPDAARPPIAASLLLGGLALASLIGLRRRRFHGG